MYFNWDHRNADIGFHSVVLKHSNGGTVPATEVSLWDYTCDFQREKVKHDPRLKDVAFRWCWCCGWSHEEEYLLTDGLTLEEVQRKIEIWILQGFIESHKSAIKRVAETRPYAAWAEEKLKSDARYRGLADETQPDTATQAGA